MVLESLAVGAAVASGAAGFFIAKKMEAANYEIHVAQARAKAKAIEHEAELILSNSNIKVKEAELEAKRRYDDKTIALKKAAKRTGPISKNMALLFYFFNDPNCIHSFTHIMYMQNMRYGLLLCSFGHSSIAWVIYHRTCCDDNGGTHTFSSSIFSVSLNAHEICHAWGFVCEYFNRWNAHSFCCTASFDGRWDLAVGYWIHVS
jgi:hypothetical protein